jgi:hypothetical protein
MLSWKATRTIGSFLEKPPWCWLHIERNARTLFDRRRK